MDGGDGHTPMAFAEGATPRREIDLVMEQHEAYLRRKAARAEAKRREQEARKAAADAQRARAAELALAEAEEAARRKAEEAARQEAVEIARKRAEEIAQRKAELRARREAEAAARRAAEEAESREAEARAQRKAEEAALADAEDAERQAAEDSERRDAEEAAREQAGKAARAEAEEAARREAEKAARRQAEDAARRTAKERTAEARPGTAQEGGPFEPLNDPDAPPRETARQEFRHPADGQPDDADAAATPPRATPRRRARTEEAAPLELPQSSRVSTRALSGWDALDALAIDPDHLERQRLISARRRDPAHVAFDVLRTRLLAALRENGWSRVAITSPTKNCGKSFIAANLAISLSRQASCYTILSDMDLRRPSLARMFGAESTGRMGRFLTGEARAREVYLRIAPNELNIGENLALGLNRRAESYAAELLQGPEAGPVLKRLDEALLPDVHLFDLPPALYHDDVLAFRAHYDGVLLVVGGGVTRPGDVREVKRRLGEDTPLLGVVMNKAEGLSIADYNY